MMLSALLAVGCASAARPTAKTTAPRPESPVSGTVSLFVCDTTGHGAALAEAVCGRLRDAGAQCRVAAVAAEPTSASADVRSARAAGSAYAARITVIDLRQDTAAPEAAGDIVMLPASGAVGRTAPIATGSSELHHDLRIEAVASVRATGSATTLDRWIELDGVLAMEGAALRWTTLYGVLAERVAARIRSAVATARPH